MAVNTAKNYLTAQGRRPPSEDILAEDAESYDVGTHLRDVDTPENEMLSSELEKVVFDTAHLLLPLNTHLPPRQFVSLVQRMLLIFARMVSCQLLLVLVEKQQSLRVLLLLIQRVTSVIRC